MAGSASDPVKLDVFQRLVSVHFPRNGYLIISANGSTGFTIDSRFPSGEGYDTYSLVPGGDFPAEYAVDVFTPMQIIKDGAHSLDLPQGAGVTPEMLQNLWAWTYESGLVTRPPATVTLTDRKLTGGYFFDHAVYAGGVAYPNTGPGGTDNSIVKYVEIPDGADARTTLWNAFYPDDPVPPDGQLTGIALMSDDAYNDFNLAVATDPDSGRVDGNGDLIYPGPDWATYVSGDYTLTDYLQFNNNTLVIQLAALKAASHGDPIAFTLDMAAGPTTLSFGFDVSLVGGDMEDSDGNSVSGFPTPPGDETTGPLVSVHGDFVLTFTPAPPKLVGQFTPVYHHI